MNCHYYILYEYNTCILHAYTERKDRDADYDRFDCYLCPQEMSMLRFDCAKPEDLERCIAEAYLSNDIDEDKEYIVSILR
jgi:hypothetical protein